MKVQNQCLALFAWALPGCRGLPNLALWQSVRRVLLMRSRPCVCIACKWLIIPRKFTQMYFRVAGL